LLRRTFLQLAVGAAAVPALVRGAVAADYPARPVDIVVGFPPGLAIDIASRLIGQALSQRMGQQFVIDNRPGAGGNIAAETVVRASPDGYTLLGASVANAVNATLYRNIGFNFSRDFVPVGLVDRVPNVVVVNPSVPAATLGAFIAYAKANPGKINYASAGNGSASNTTGELLRPPTSSRGSTKRSREPRRSRPEGEIRQRRFPSGVDDNAGVRGLHPH
jgi:tripartite-type tricarboxylate transporter receptor subunit TctC